MWTQTDAMLMGTQQLWQCACVVVLANGQLLVQRSISKPTTSKLQLHYASCQRAN
jgi:hypothetical protein